MKREIVCPECDQRSSLNLAKVSAKYSEFFKTVKGVSLRSVICDICTAPIDVGDKAAARSFAPSSDWYAPWENEYLQPDKEEK